MKQVLIGHSNSIKLTKSIKLASEHVISFSSYSPRRHWPKSDANEIMICIVLLGLKGDRHCT